MVLLDAKVCLKLVGIYWPLSKRDFDSDSAQSNLARIGIVPLIRQPLLERPRLPVALASELALT